MNWKLVEYTGAYYYWSTVDDDGETIYNCTTSNNPPQTNSGYYNLDAFKKLKNDEGNCFFMAKARTWELYPDLRPSIVNEFIDNPMGIVKLYNAMVDADGWEAGSDFMSDLQKQMDKNMKG